MIADILNFQPEKINMHDPYDIDDNTLKIDMSIEKLKPVMLRMTNLQVLSFTNELIVLSLKGNENLKKIFDDIDAHIVSIIQDKKITKRLKTKFNYRQLTSTYTNKSDSSDILSLSVNLNSERFHTEIYQRADKKLSHNEALNMMKDNVKVDIVLEITGVIFNKADGFIYLDNLVRQMKVRKIKPKRVEKIQYSFVDSESESESDKSNKSDRLNGEYDDSDSELELKLESIHNYTNDENDNDIELESDSETSN